MIATAAELLGLTHSPGMPMPLRTIDGDGREQIAAVFSALELR